MTKHDQLLKAVRERKGRGQKFGHGIWPADRYVQTLAECVGVGICQTYFGGLKAQAFSQTIKEAAEKLTFAGEQLVLDEKLATGEREMKSILGDMDLPAHSMLAFTHTLTTPREDRDGDILETSGAEVDSKMPLLWQHIHTLPIGKMLKVVEKTAERLRLASVLLDINELTSDAAKLIEAKALRFSHGFRALEFSERDKAHGAPGFQVKSFEIMEESLVSVPSNVEAEIELLGKRKLKSTVFKEHAKAMERILRSKRTQVPVTVKLGSFQELQEAAATGLVKTLVEQGVTEVNSGPGMDSNVGTDPGAARSLSHADDGEKHSCGCGGKSQDQSGEKEPADLDESAKAALARDEFDNQTDAEMRSAVLGCLLHHQIVGAGGKIVYKPCRNPEEYTQYSKKPPSLPKPAASAIPEAKDGSKAAKLTEKLWLDGSSLKGSYVYRLQKLNEDAPRILTAAGITLNRETGTSVWSLFDGYGIICVHKGGYYGDAYPSSDKDGDYYRAAWAEADGDPKWTGEVQAVSVSASLTIEAEKVFKAGRTLSQANVDKLQSALDDIAAAMGQEIPRAANAALDRARAIISGVLDAAAPILDEDPQPKSVTPDEAASILLDSPDVALLKRTHNTLGTLLAVHYRGQKSKRLRNILRR